jgi:hypothetical protein
MAYNPITCRHCGAEAQADAARCPSCNKRLAPVRSSAAAPAEAPEPEAAQAAAPAETAPAQASPAEDPVYALLRDDAVQNVGDVEEAEEAAGQDPVDLTGCMACGREPVAEVLLQSNTGMVFARRWAKVEGRFCRPCGLSLYRKHMNHTLLAGWWGFISFFMNFGAIFKNFKAWRTLTSLSEPPAAEQPVRPPLPPGKPLFQRAGIYVTAVLVAFLGFVAVASTSGGADEFKGKCITIDRAANKVKTAGCGGTHDGKVLDVLKDQNACPAGTDGTLRLKADSDKYICVDVDQ